MAFASPGSVAMTPTCRNYSVHTHALAAISLPIARQQRYHFPEGYRVQTSSDPTADAQARHRIIIQCVHTSKQTAQGRLKARYSVTSRKCDRLVLTLVAEAPAQPRYLPPLAAVEGGGGPFLPTRMAACLRVSNGLSSSKDPKGALGFSGYQHWYYNNTCTRSLSSSSLFFRILKSGIPEFLGT